MVIDPKNDGITHINTYSKAATPLGQMLSNFYRFHIETEDGPFKSVEGYWAWLSVNDCQEKDKLRKLYGFMAKNTGKELVAKYGKRWDENFEKKILKAIEFKFKANSDLLIDKYKHLPFEHYYVFSGKVVDAKPKYPWMIHGMEDIRKEITGQKNNTDSSGYLKCPLCEYQMTAVRYLNKKIDEKNKMHYYNAVDYLFCEECGHTECVDDSFDIEISEKEYNSLISNKEDN